MSLNIKGLINKVQVKHPRISSHKSQTAICILQIKSLLYEYFQGRLSACIYTVNRMISDIIIGDANVCQRH